MISKSSFACEIGPGIIGVPADLRFQSVQRVEADLVPEPLVEFHPDGLAVEIPVKIQHPGFHRQVAAVVDGVTQSCQDKLQHRSLEMCMTQLELNIFLYLEVQNL